MTEGNHWWYEIVTPDGVHLYEFGYADADTADEQAAIVAKLREIHGFPTPEVWPWRVSFSPGRPEGYFDYDTPKAGVTVHDLTETRSLIV